MAMDVVRGKREIFGFIVPEDLKEVKDKIAKLNAKFGKEIYKLDQVNEYESYKRKFLRLDFTIINPVKDDYTVLAMIDHSDHVIYNWSDVDLEKFRTRTTCDHCNTNHRRAKTFIVKTKDGELQQIGSSCFTKITGSAYTRSLSKFFTNPSDDLNKIISFNVEDLREKKEPMFYDPRDIVDVTAAIIKEVGFVSVNSTGFGDSTCKKVFDAFRGRLKLAGFDINKVPKVTDEFKKFLSDNRQNRFLNECFHIIQNEQIHSRTVPTLVAGVASWLRDNDKKAVEKATNTGKSDNKPIQVTKYDGPNKNVDCVAERVYVNDGEWGMSVTYYFLVDNKYRLRWTTYSGGIDGRVAPGDKIKLERFTIGEHNNTSKIPSTKITRVKAKKI